MNVIDVGRPSLIVLILENMRELTLEKNHMDAISVGKPSVRVITSDAMR